MLLFYCNVFPGGLCFGRNFWIFADYLCCLFHLAFIDLFQMAVSWTPAFLNCDILAQLSPCFVLFCYFLYWDISSIVQNKGVSSGARLNFCATAKYLFKGIKSFFCQKQYILFKDVLGNSLQFSIAITDDGVMVWNLLFGQSYTVDVLAHGFFFIVARVVIVYIKVDRCLEHHFLVLTWFSFNCLWANLSRVVHRSHWLSVLDILQAVVLQ